MAFFFFPPTRLLIPFCTVENRLHYCDYCLFFFLFNSRLRTASRQNMARDLRREGWELGPVLFCLRERLADARGIFVLSTHISEEKNKTKLHRLAFQTAARALTWSRWFHSLIRCDL